MPTTATAKIDPTAAQAIRMGLYGPWRMWRQNPSTSEMLAAAGLLSRRPECEKIPDIHYVIWQQNFHGKKLRKKSASDLPKLQDLAIADGRLWEHIRRYRPRFGMKTLDERLDLVAQDPGYNSFRANTDDGALVASQVGGEAGRGGSAPPPK
jgi:hypothetical protein